MTKMIAVAVLMATSGVTLAEPKTYDEAMALCEKHAEFADVLMQRRQLGWPKSMFVEIAEGNPFILDVVDRAYEYPIRVEEGDKVRSVHSFHDAELERCLNEELG